MSTPIFKRKLYDQLLAWKQTSGGQTALLIEGARRVGKSTGREEVGDRRVVLRSVGERLLHELEARVEAKRTTV